MTDGGSAGCEFLGKVFADDECRKNEQAQDERDGDNAQGDGYDVQGVVFALSLPTFRNIFFDYNDASVGGDSHHVPVGVFPAAEVQVGVLHLQLGQSDGDLQACFGLFCFGRYTPYKIFCCGLLFDVIFLQEQEDDVLFKKATLDGHSLCVQSGDGASD